MKSLRESIATLLHHYYYGPEYYDVGPTDIKVSRRQGESMKNYQGMSDRKLIRLAEILTEGSPGRIGLPLIGLAEILFEDYDRSGDRLVGYPLALEKED
jgi:hypothetical protein